MTRLRDTPGQFVLPLPRIQIERLEYEDPTRLSYRDDVVLVPQPLDPSVPDWISALDRRGQLSTGTLLVQNFMSRQLYLPFEEADIGLAEHKASVFADLCQLLGARHARVDIIRDQRRSLRSGGKITGIPVQGFRFRATSSREKVERLHSSIRTDDQFAGGHPDIAGARDLLKRSGLDGDLAMTGLVGSRERPQNPHLTRTVTLNLSSETQRILRIGASVNVPSFLQPIVSADWKRVASHASNFRVRYTVEF